MERVATQSSGSWGSRCSATRQQLGEAAARLAVCPSMPRVSAVPLEFRDPEIAGLIQATLAELIQTLSLGIVIVDGTCRLLFADQLARRILQRADAIAECHGRLRLAHRSSRDKLSVLVERMAGDGNDDPELLRLSRPAGNALLLMARKLAGAGGSSGRVLLLLSDPDLRAELAPDDLGPLFELTPSEIRLLGALLRGESLTDYAKSGGISRNTARTQLKGIFQKTGFGRQAELVGAMLGDPLLHLVVSRGGIPVL
jgi:DNA-binding CsgD family transcriptional regulator